MNLFKKPINCYHYRNRYKALISLHVVDTITFIIRFILICIDLSNKQQIPLYTAYSLFIFFLELIGSLPFVFSDIVYFVICCFKHELFRDDHHPVCCRRRTASRFATLTCFPCHCYQEHPQGMQLTRVAILICCYIIRFIAFILGASCATTFNPHCVPYTVISSFALLPSFFTLIIEWFHFHLLWNYQPIVGNSLTNRRDRSHLRFLPDKLINEERIQGWRTSLCENQNECHSKSLHHTLLYHSIHALVNDDLTPIRDNERIIAYHVTTTELAIKIAQDGFPLDNYRKVIPDIYFTRSVETWANVGAGNLTAIICVRLNVDCVFQATTVEEFNFVAHVTRQPMPHTLELARLGRIKVLFPGQIENWVITLHAASNETFDISVYDGCI